MNIKINIKYIFNNDEKKRKFSQIYKEKKVKIKQIYLVPKRIDIDDFILRFF